MVVSRQLSVKRLSSTLSPDQGGKGEISGEKMEA